MSDSNGFTSTGEQTADYSTPAADVKGKGKATEQPMDVSMDEDEESEDSGIEEPVEEAEPEDEDNMEEIDTDNIIADGRRTRGKAIDFAKVQQEEGVDDDDEDDDEDFVEDDDADAMEH